MSVQPGGIATVRAAFGREFLIVTLSRHPEGCALADLRRVQTSKEALAAGADILLRPAAIFRGWLIGSTGFGQLTRMCIWRRLHSRTPRVISSGP
jgi:hypothetical protein